MPDVDREKDKDKAKSDPTDVDEREEAHAVADYPDEPADPTPEPTADETAADETAADETAAKEESVEGEPSPNEQFQELARDAKWVLLLNFGLNIAAFVLAIWVLLGALGILPYSSEVLIAWIAALVVMFGLQLHPKIKEIKRVRRKMDEGQLS